MKIKLKHLFEHKDRHGNWRLYMRRRGKPWIRIRSMPGTAAFLTEYEAGLAKWEAGSTPARQAGVLPASIQWLCNRYFTSAEFKRLAPSTRRVRRQIYDRICAKDGDKPWAQLEARHIRQRRDALSDVPESANAIIKALRQLYKWAMEAVDAKYNPARDVPYLRSGSEGFHTWTVPEVNQYRARWKLGTKQRLALDLLLLSGVRRGDAVKLGRQMARDGWLYFVEGKNISIKRKERSIPILPELQASIDATPSGHLTYLTTEFGKPYTAGGFGNWFRRQCNEANLPHCSAHGLRKAGATVAANNGATEHQLMAIFGWESPKQAALYTRKANRKKLAGDAMHLIQPENECELPEAVGREGDSQKRKNTR